MKTLTLRKTAASVLLASLILTAACSGNNSQSAGSNNSAGTSGTNSAANTDTAGTANEDGPISKYNPPITVSMIRPFDQTATFQPGESMEKNNWATALEQELGVIMKYPWGPIPGGQYEDKINIAIASNQLPDISQLAAPQLKQLVDAGSLEDLYPAYNKYATPLLKKIVEADGGRALKTATFDGKLMALTVPNGIGDAFGMLWVRKDWLDKLGLPEPKTMQDVQNIAQAFAKDGKIGLALDKDLIGNTFTLDGFANGYHAYPKKWIKDSNGKLVYGSIQPEMRTALQEAQKLYKDGAMDKEFGVKTADTVAQDFAAGKIGMTYGAMFFPLWPFADNKKNDPAADWRPYPIVSVDGKPAMPIADISSSGYFAAKKGFAHPEVIIKLANFYAEKFWSDHSTKEDYAKLREITVDDGKGGKKSVTVWFQAPFMVESGGKNQDNYIAINEALKTGDASKLNPEQTSNYNDIKKWLDNKDINGYGYNGVFGKGGSEGIILNYLQNENNYLINEFYGSATATMAARKSTLDKMELEVFTKIIMGAPIEDFDKFVQNWNKLGGEQITKEVNDWSASVNS
ncbi:extracellular solute-binding protein (plasmid) [Paenibacillus rhizovicinus]|uniref:Extracellular solute-binding protein n=1 Tax=Paenibacillus rhizovicinus TaxID=2704463 RepID=A0A6C0PAD9_9BACL|nr:extracellular solute-binding protein [Paenibacillus rhizovicinus]QHW35517.1 extracellular solute-binding protein [Paenibacillus rhizovicinus]